MLSNGNNFPNVVFTIFAIAGPVGALFLVALKCLQAKVQILSNKMHPFQIFSELNGHFGEILLKKGLNSYS